MGGRIEFRIPRVSLRKFLYRYLRIAAAYYPAFKNICDRLLKDLDQPGPFLEPRF